MVGWPAETAQPACPQLQEISVELPVSLQYWLQYFPNLPPSQLQAGWAHFLALSAIRVPFRAHLEHASGHRGGTGYIGSKARFFRRVDSAASPRSRFRALYP